MSAVARTFQYFFLIGGIAVCLAGLWLAYDDPALRDHRAEWVCKPDTVTDNASRCISEGQNTSAVRDVDGGTGEALLLGGIALIGASISVAVGANRPRREAPAGPAPAAYSGPPAGPGTHNPYQ